MGKPDIDLYFNDAYVRTFNAVSRYVASHASRFQDSEDIIQNVYTRFYKRICEKGYADIESAEAFLINIAKFECRTFLAGFVKRREKVRNLSDFSEEESAALIPTVPAQAVLIPHRPAAVLPGPPDRQAPDPKTLSVLVPVPADQQAHPRAHSCPRRLRRTTITTTCGRQGDTEETAAVSAPFWHLSLFW